MACIGSSSYSSKRFHLVCFQNRPMLAFGYSLIHIAHPNDQYNAHTINIEYAIQVE